MTGYLVNWSQIWLMTLQQEHCHTGSVFIAAKLKKDRLNLTLMTHDWEPCQLVPNMANDSSIRACNTGSLFIVAKLKKKQTKPNPNDS